MASYEEVIEKDLELLWSVKQYCHSNVWLSDLLSRIVSKHPLRDIVIIVWVFFIIGLFEVGIRHFWVAVFNVIFAMGKQAYQL